MSKCYKCGSAEQLSIKSQRKSTGYKLMICRTCRRAVHQGKPIQLVESTKDEVPDEWTSRAIESIERISKKYARPI